MGFAVVDYLAVDDALGDWSAISRIADRFTLMVDLVLNHASSESAWFKQFVAGEAPGRDYFITADPGADLSQVVRPRTSPLLRPTTTSDGERHVWCTFGHDQCDLDFSNPDVLIEVLRHHRRLPRGGRPRSPTGRRRLPLEAPRHTVHPSGRDPSGDPPPADSPGAALPGGPPGHRDERSQPENLTYFGNANEAHAIYNFTLPPLLLDALLRGRSEHLRTWMMSMPPAPLGATYLNFLASHDGIGVRPAEGILTDEEIAGLAEAVRDRGGRVSAYAGPSTAPVRTS